jgi:hypothetical protein
MLPPGVQLAASDRREVTYDNDEEFAQKDGRLVRINRLEKPERLALVGIPLLSIVILLVLQLIG